MIGTANWWRRYLWRANPPTWFVCHFRPPCNAAQACRKLTKNASQMCYADYREKKFFVGSGVVEAGCRTVIGERLKQSGMRWSVRGANAIIALRCCILSGRFEDFWASRTP